MLNVLGVKIVNLCGMTLDALMWCVLFRQVGDVWTPCIHHLHAREKNVIKTLYKH